MADLLADSRTLNNTYAQFVIGTPGAGKSTYCAGVLEFMRLLNRKCIVVNLDPANEYLPYECDVDIKDLIRLDDVMNNSDGGDALGPNGGLLFCMEYLEKTLLWLKDALRPYQYQWILFDCPGQVELYTVHSSMKNIFTMMADDWKWRVACVHLIDVAHCLDHARFISALLLSLTAMVYLELPHINVLSKMDQLQIFGRLRLLFYTDVLDLSHLVMLLESEPFMARHAKLNSAICNLIEQYSMVQFCPLKIENKKSLFQLLRRIDAATGYPFNT